MLRKSQTEMFLNRILLKSYNHLESWVFWDTLYNLSWLSQGLLQQSSPSPPQSLPSSDCKYQTKLVEGLSYKSKAHLDHCTSVLLHRNQHTPSLNNFHLRMYEVQQGLHGIRGE